jgi:polyisoprenoid-binding protein YceI
VKKLIIYFALLFTVTNIQAAPSVWKMIPEKSRLVFAATQNNAPLKGEFKKFDAEIHFDLDQLKQSRVKIIVDINSLASSYEELTSTLKLADWFDMKVFPQAVFEAREFVKKNDIEYEAKGNLTIRNKTLPITLTFKAVQSDATHGMVKGYTTIKRTAFGVGQGEWASVDEIKDDVRVDFEVNATK